MRDLVLNEAMRRLAAEAATRFSSLVATGEEIPFDLAGEAGPDSLFYSYVPRTGHFVLERERELRSLPAFGPACDAVDDAGVAAPFLEARGHVVPGDPQERAARMLTIFIASLWEGSTDFSLDRKRLDEALASLGAEARALHEADLLLCPLVGLRMPLSRLQLPHGVRIVRADTIDAPIDAMRSEGMGRAAWEPQFLALAEQGADSGGPAEAMRQLRELISVMRLFKAGGVGLGPYAFAPTGEGQWRRIATGAPATRPGGYELSEDEAAELGGFAEALEARPDPDSGLVWSVGRFEMGCERATALEGLSDQLLALRAVLEGHGPIGASLPMRAAALIADDNHDRIRARERVEHALELERTLMNGATPDPGTAPDLARWVEGGVRIMLRNAALGELGSDISTAADESLLATGLEAGDAEIAVTAQEDAGTSDEVADRAAQGGQGVGASADGSGREAEQ
ncbi:MAG TPA: hypothetical protein VG518_10345, partial [Solirubrobacterales bacterium]|nr:hypothetical protein [Solirubrobacterales bacterium]